MKRRPATKLSKRALARADALVAELAGDARTELPDVAELLDCWPLVFRGALSYLLSEFDYAAHRDSNIATAVRLLALSAERVERLRALPR